jgi:DNA modification methylase
MTLTTHHGDCLEVLPTLEAGSIQTIVTSPPYWRMRKYTDDPRELGQEPTPAAYVAALVAVFAACWRVLRDDGTLWLNLGDGYSRSGGTDRAPSATAQVGSTRRTLEQMPDRRQKAPEGLPAKNLIGLPWRVAFALQDAGWVLRSEIIWHKPNAMPESVTDRPTRDHETLFLFAKQPHYYYDAKAIAEPAKEHHAAAASFKRTGNKRSTLIIPGQHSPTHRSDRPDVLYSGGERNARTVWSISTTPLADEHYAPMPQALAERCIRAGSRIGDTVLDPFGGSGTTGRAAIALQRSAVLIDLGYQELQARRTDGVQVHMAGLEEAA